MPLAQATTYYNLTSLQADGTTPTGYDTVTINNALFTSNTNSEIVGTGVLNPFVRVQQNGNGNCKDPCIESGYNTDGSEQFETKDKGGTNWDHSLLLSNVGTETINGVLYRNFILDINEANNSSDRYLSLDKLKIYLGSVGNLDNYTESAPDGSGVDSLKSQNGAIVATKVYDIDLAVPPGGGAPTDSTIALNYNLNSGSGKGIDLIARIPDSVFHIAGDPQYVYLYSSFGATGDLKNTNNNGWSGNGPPPDTSPAGILPLGNYGQSAGFEEWSTRVKPGTLLQNPEPMSFALVLAGLAALGIARQQRRSPGR